MSMAGTILSTDHQITRAARRRAVAVLGRPASSTDYGLPRRREGLPNLARTSIWEAGTLGVANVEVDPTLTIVVPSGMVRKARGAVLCSSAESCAGRTGKWQQTGVLYVENWLIAIEKACSRGIRRNGLRERDCQIYEVKQRQDGLQFEDDRSWRRDSENLPCLRERRARRYLRVG
jgi:hypothetical protein